MKKQRKEFARKVAELERPSFEILYNLPITVTIP
jgi:hypothetical protein